MPKKNLPLYTVVRNGEFKCRLKEENQCGPAGTSQFDYRATIEGHVLDGDDRTRGIDNFLIEHYGMADRVSAVFGFGKWQASCEAFAGSIVTMIHEMMGGRATRIHVSIKPGGLAEIQLEWRQGQSLPTLLAVRL